MPVKEDGSFDLAKVPRLKGTGKGGASLQEHPALKHKAQRDKMLEPVPQGIANPVEWAEKHVESIQPDAAKEVEWALKFGSDALRYTAARDVLAMKGLTTKPKEQVGVQQAMVFNFSGPTSPSGAPIMPFSNAAPALAAPVIPPQLSTTRLDAAPDAVTVAPDATSTPEPK